MLNCPLQIRSINSIPRTLRRARRDRAFHINGVEFYGKISFLKAGLYDANDVCTVSPTYANEITTEAFGGGLHGLMRGLTERGQLSGILNGLDDSWDPKCDPHLPVGFDADNPRAKALADIVRTCFCVTPSRGPLFCIVSRLVSQKGPGSILGIRLKRKVPTTPGRLRRRLKPLMNFGMVVCKGLSQRSAS